MIFKKFIKNTIINANPFIDSINTDDTKQLVHSSEKRNANTFSENNANTFSENNANTNVSHISENKNKYLVGGVSVGGAATPLIIYWVFDKYNRPVQSGSSFDGTKSIRLVPVNSVTTQNDIINSIIDEEQPLETSTILEDNLNLNSKKTEFGFEPATWSTESERLASSFNGTKSTISAPINSVIDEEEKLETSTILEDKDISNSNLEKRETKDHTSQFGLQSIVGTREDIKRAEPRTKTVEQLSVIKEEAEEEEETDINLSIIIKNDEDHLNFDSQLKEAEFGFESAILPMESAQDANMTFNDDMPDQLWKKQLDDEASRSRVLDDENIITNLNFNAEILSSQDLGSKPSEETKRLPNEMFESFYPTALLESVIEPVVESAPALDNNNIIYHYGKTYERQYKNPSKESTNDILRSQIWLPCETGVVRQLENKSTNQLLDSPQQSAKNPFEDEEPALFQSIVLS